MYTLSLSTRNRDCLFSFCLLISFSLSYFFLPLLVLTIINHIGQATTFEEGYNVRKDFGEKIGKANQQNPSQLFEAQYSSSSSTPAEPSTSSFADENEEEEEADHEVDSSNCDVPTSFAPGESWLDIPLSKRLEIGRKVRSCTLLCFRLYFPLLLFFLMVSLFESDSH